VLDRVAVDLGELVDVVTLVPALGRLLPAPPRLDGGAKEIDLPTGVVEVVLAFDLVSGVVENPRDRVAVCAVRADPTVNGPAGLAEMSSTWIFCGVSGEPAP